jgi:hypothetical protein
MVLPWTYNVELLAHETETRGNHRPPCADHGSVYAENKEHKVLLPHRPIKWITGTVTRLWNKDNIIISPSAMFQVRRMGNYVNISLTWDVTIAQVGQVPRSEDLRQGCRARNVFKVTIFQDPKPHFSDLLSPVIEDTITPPGPHL